MVANALVALEPGQSADVPVYTARATGYAGITVTAASESDRTKTGHWRITRGD